MLVEKVSMPDEPPMLDAAVPSGRRVGAGDVSRVSACGTVGVPHTSADKKDDSADAMGTLVGFFFFQTFVSSFTC